MCLDFCKGCARTVPELDITAILGHWPKTQPELPMLWSISSWVTYSDQSRMSAPSGSISRTRVPTAMHSGWESRYYMQKQAVPVLVVEVEEPGELVTHLEFG